jgi:hypothetical protein
MTYTILHNENSETLAHRVNQMIADGWEPLGGVSVFSSTYSPAVYNQAMIKPSSH